MTTVTYTAASSAHENSLPQQRRSARSYNFAAGYLRAFLTVLVVAHHAMLAYVALAPLTPRSLTAQPQWWLAFPIVDSRRWPGFDLLVGFNDTFFMSLMFFLSGLFVWNSLGRKGPGVFLHDRAVRLGIPFLASIAVLAPLAYFPTYLVTGSPASFGAFGKQWLSLGHWPSGPAWFLSLLLAFDCLAAGLFIKFPHWATSLGHALSRAYRTPARLFGVVLVISAGAYIPMAITFNPLIWTTFGPFTFQTSRVFHYAIYFLIGVSLGALGLDRTLLAQDGKLANRWPCWLIFSLGAFAVQIAAALTAVSARTAVSLWTTLAGFTFVLSCAAISFACLAFFARFAARRLCMLDSLRDNAYGIYLFHYLFVNWLQYALLKAALPAATKGIFVFFGALALSWITTAILRRIPMITRMI